MDFGSGVLPKIFEDRAAWLRVVAAAMVHGATMQCAGEDEILDAIMLILNDLEAGR